MTAPASGPVLEIYLDSYTSLSARPRWTPLRQATAAEIELSSMFGSFWLTISDEPYYAAVAASNADRAARVVWK